MQRVLEVFRESIARVEHLGGLYEAIGGLTTQLLDTSDMLRAQIVLSVSALDFYIHEVTLRGMLEVYTGKRSRTAAFEKYRISLGAMLMGAPAGGDVWLEAEIRERHSFLSFQQPDKIADAIRLFSSVPLWSAVAANLGIDDLQVKQRLKLIIERRNKIAHEADMDPSYPGARWPIAKSDATACKQFIGELVEAIHLVVV